VKPRRVQIPGPVAENKDWARNMRDKVLLPTLASGREIILDFKAVSTATQSFVHACISQAVTEHGEDVLDRIQFRQCNEQVHSIIERVVEYSLRARTLTHQGLSSTITKKDVPQAYSLNLVREVIDALASGDATPADVAATTGFTMRHVQYRLHAARILGLAKFVRNFATLTEKGIALSRTGRDSPDERRAFEAAIKESAVMSAIAPNLLGNRAPDVNKLALRLEKKTGLSPSTARRRASSLLTWRHTICQMRLL